MLKHIITHKCPFDHSYCITRNLKCDEQLDLFETSLVYHSLFLDHSEIMITGGEPTKHPYIYGLLGVANAVFPHVYLTTANREFLVDPYANLVDSITLSLHGVFCGIPDASACRPAVYASIMADHYVPTLPAHLKRLGFAGLTICEDQRSNPHYPFAITLPDLGEDFTYKINRRGECLRETIILPDLKIINDYTGYL